MPDQDKYYDVVALGELLIDFTESGYGKDGMRLFEQNPGGAPANVACAVARLGGSAAFIGKVGADMHGRFLKQLLEGMGVNSANIIEDPEVFTTLAFVALTPEGERTFSFARKPGADTCLRPEEIDPAVIRRSNILHIGSLSLTDEPARAATYAAAAHAKQAGALVSYDPNYRASLWRSKGEAVERMRGMLPYVDIMKLSDEETALLTDEASPERAAERLIRQGIRCVAVTLGAAGVYIHNTQGGAQVEGFRVPVVDTTGAGDAFWGGFLYSLRHSGKPVAALSLQELKHFATFGNATAALCIGKRGAIPAMPGMEEVQAFLRTQRR